MVFKTFLKYFQKSHIQISLLLSIVLILIAEIIFLFNPNITNFLPIFSTKTNFAGAENLNTTEKNLIQLLDRQGPEEAWKQLKAQYSSSNFGIQHNIAHLFGESLYKEKGASSLPVCDNSFAFGCYHGFFAYALAEHGVSIVTVLNQACIDKYGPLGTGCQHGIGHGLIEYFGHQQLLEALQACTLTKQEKPMFDCSSGVFMEYNLPTIVNSSTEAKPSSRTLDINNPTTPCNSIVPDKFRESCFFELAQWWSVSLGENYKKYGEFCSQIVGANYRESCFLGLGNIAAPYSTYDPSKTIYNCQSVPTQEGQLDCRAGASWSFAANPDFKSKAASICDGLTQEQFNLCQIKAHLTD